MSSLGKSRAGWTNRSLADLAVITMGQSPPSEHYNHNADGTPLVQGKADLGDRRTRPRMWTTLAPKLARASDLVLTVRAPVGSVAVASSDVCLGRGVCGLEPTEDPGFLYQALILAENRWNRLEQGTTFTAANKNQVSDFPIFVPTDLGEQRSIAAALADMDGLIASLDALIAKKQAVQAATRQELLTHRVRLPGFRDEWGTTSLGKVASIKTGERNNQDKDEDGEYPFFVRSATVERINSFSFDGEAILVPGEGGIGNIVHYIKGRFDVHQRVYRISHFSADTVPKFVYYAIVEGFHRDAARNTVKATVDSLRLPTFKNFTFDIPNSYTEQREVVRVLSDMDAEIAVLEQRRAKTLAIKQGAMQELLTGGIRLVEPQGAGGEATAS